MNVREKLEAAIRKEYECEPADCDTHSALDLAVDLGLLSMAEAESELGFATVSEWLGRPGGY